jgi:hypothetical protein
MLPDIDFLRSDVFGAVGIAVKRQNSDKSQMYLTFDNARKRTGLAFEVVHALALDANRIAASNGGRDVALIDLEAESVFVRKTIMDASGWIYRNLDRLQGSRDGRHLFAEAGYALHVLDAATLDQVRLWNYVELTPEGLRAYTPPDETTLRSRLYVDGVFRLHVDGAKELENGRLVASFEKKHFDARFVASVFARGADVSTAFFEFDIATGEVKLRTDCTLPQGDGVARPAKKRGWTKEKQLPAFEELAYNELAVTVEAPSLNEAGAIVALNALTLKIETDFDALVFRGRMFLRFILAGERLTDEDFFNKCLELRWIQAAPALRRLLTAYLRKFRGGEGVGPCWKNEHALRALILLDVEAEDVYRAHVKKHDISLYQTPCTELYRDYLKARGWRHEVDLRFSAFLTLRVILALSAPGGRWFGKSMAELNADIDRRAAEAKSRWSGWDDPKLKDMMAPVFKLDLLNLAIETTHATQQIERDAALQQFVEELVENAEKLVTPTRFVDILIEESKGYKLNFILAPFAEESTTRSSFYSAVRDELAVRVNW